MIEVYISFGTPANSSAAWYFDNTRLPEAVTLVYPLKILK